jgi:hypothetical protein
MAKGDSGRIVIEVDPTFKEEVYAALDRDGLTLKSWFVQQATKYVADHIQPGLALTAKDKQVRP